MNDDDPPKPHPCVKVIDEFVETGTKLMAAVPE